MRLGREIQAMQFNSKSDLDAAQEARTRWIQYNTEYLRRSFDNESIALGYGGVSAFGAMFINASFGQQVESFIGAMSKQINALVSIIERLELIPKIGGSPAVETEAPPSFSSSSDFIVHGTNSAAKTEIARFVEKLGLTAVILHEQENQGLTIIEKFEKHAASAGFAVVLLTPDDVAAPQLEPRKLRARARQNVILELGYFCGALTRGRVAVMNWPEVEVPSDIHGLVYIPYDSSNGWHLALAREFKRAGLSVDLNRVL